MNEIKIQSQLFFTINISSVQFSSFAQLYLTLQTHGLQHNRPLCPLQTLRVYSNSCPLSRWCHTTISSSAIPFSSCLQSFSASGSSQISHFFASGGQTIGVSALASVLPVKIQDCFPLGWTGNTLFLGLQNHYRWWLQPWNCWSLEEKLWQT